MAQVTSPILLDSTGQSINTKLEGIRAALAAEVTVATTATAGIVKPDGTTIAIAPDGTISSAAAVDIATTATAGIVKPDGTSILLGSGGTISTSKSAIGLGNVNNTSDNDKPVSTAQAAAISAKASKPTYVQVTVAASGWSNSVYSFESQYSSSSYDITDILPNDNTTDAQRAAWIAADCGGYRSTNTIKAHGTVPTIDIVLTLVVVAK